MNRTQRAVLGLVVPLAFALTSCGGGSTAPPPPEVTLDRSTAPAGSIVKVDGLLLDACPLRSSEIRVAGQTAPTVLNARHEALMRLPLFYDDQTKWAAPPEGPQDVEVFCNGDLLVALPAAITITELPPAPGTTEALLVDYQQIVSDYKALTEMLAPAPGIQQQLFTAIFATLDDLVAGTGPNSLPAQLGELQQVDPEALALMDAGYAISDVDEVVAAFKDHLQQMLANAAASGPVTPATSPKSVLRSSPSDAQPITPPFATAPKAVGIYELPFPVSMDDARLNQLMSAYEGLNAFGKDFVAPTAESFGTFNDFLSIFIESKTATTINAVLTFLDFTLNQLVLSAMPSSFDEIVLQLSTTMLANSEVTFSKITVNASNVPESLSINDVTSNLLMKIGLDRAGDVPGAEVVLPWIEAFEENLREASSALLAKLVNEFQEYADANPGAVDYDMQVFAIIPQMHFQAQGETSDLYRLFPDHSNVVHPLQAQLEWQASDTYWGSAEVNVTPAPGAFGGQTKPSNGVRVRVGQLALEFDAPGAVVPEGGATAVGLKLSHASEESISVSVGRAAGDSDISVSSGQSIAFDSSNWNFTQDVVLTAAEDNDDEDGEATIRAHAEVQLSGDNPTAIEATLTAVEADNDRMHFVMDPSSVRVPEGETAEVQVKLSHPPPSRVVAIVVFANGDRDLIFRSPIQMRFDENNWDSYQTVTLYARPDDDIEEGKAQFRVSANPPAEIDETYITATEDEPGTTLSIQYEEWNLNQRSTAEGKIAVELDRDNFAYPLANGPIDAYHTFDFEDIHQAFPGTAYISVSNFPMGVPACPCGPASARCYERQDPNDIILEITGRFQWDCPPEISCIGWNFYMIFPVVEGTAFEMTCTDSGSGTSYSLELDF